VCIFWLTRDNTSLIEITSKKGSLGEPFSYTLDRLEYTHEPKGCCRGTLCE